MAVPLSLQLRTDDPGNAFATAIESLCGYLHNHEYEPWER